MYDTKNMMKKSDKEKNTIHVGKIQHFEKFNAFQGGYGVHEKSKKAKNRATRKENKKACSMYE